MADVSQSQPVPQTDQSRSVVILVYLLYLAAVISVGLAGIAGVIVAYIKRAETQDIAWKSHFDNQITAFWVWLVFMIVGGSTFWVLGLGFVIMAIGFVWFIYRTVKGLIRALEFKPYA